MPQEKDAYYDRFEVSNSDLSTLQKYWQSLQLQYDLQKAYDFGTLIDCMLTEPQKVNYFNFTCAGIQFSKADFEIAEAMKISFLRDQFCRLLLENSETQKITIRENFKINYLGFDFTLNARCKWDFFAKQKIGITADLKSTVATSEKAFRNSIELFEYHRQAAWYMDLENIDSHMLIGICKKAPYSIFKVAIKRGDDMYKAGRALYQELAFKHYQLFTHLKIAI